MNAVLAKAPEISLLLVGKEFRRDLHITFDPSSDIHRFRVAVHPKGKGKYFDRPFVALGLGPRIRFLEWSYIRDNDLSVGGATFRVSDEERAQIESWLAAIPGGAQ